MELAAVGDISLTGHVCYNGANWHILTLLLYFDGIDCDSTIVCVQPYMTTAIDKADGHFTMNSQPNLLQ